MTERAGDVWVQIKYKGVEKTFSGSLEEVWLLINRFFSEFLPSFDVASKLTLSVDLGKLAKDCEGLIAFSKEGPSLLVPKGKLTDAEALTLWLLASYIGHQLGMLEDSAVSRDDLQLKLGKSSKITSTRLSELIKSGVATKTADGKYRITSFGVLQAQRKLLHVIRERLALNTLSRF